MVAEIGILIAFYVLTRMLSLIVRAETLTIVRFFAVLTIIVSVVVGFSLFVGATTAGGDLRGLR